MNRQQADRLKVGDIVQWKAKGQYSSSQTMGPLCVVLAVTARGGVKLREAHSGAVLWKPYQALYSYPATAEHARRLRGEPSI